MRVRRRELAVAAVWALVFGAAPTVGDVGSCGRVATDLDEASFAAARKSVDCSQCTACGFQTQTCQQACDPNAPGDVGWPATCHPLQHDGEVCLHALQAASCGAYGAYVSDTDPTVPTECDFCHLIPGGGGGAAGAGSVDVPVTPGTPESGVPADSGADADAAAGMGDH